MILYKFGVFLLSEESNLDIRIKNLSVFQIRIFIGLTARTLHDFLKSKVISATLNNFLILVIMSSFDTRGPYFYKIRRWTSSVLVVC